MQAQTFSEMACHSKNSHKVAAEDHMRTMQGRKDRSINFNSSHKVAAEDKKIKCTCCKGKKRQALSLKEGACKGKPQAEKDYAEHKALGTPEGADGRAG